MATPEAGAYFRKRFYVRLGPPLWLPMVHPLRGLALVLFATLVAAGAAAQTPFQFGFPSVARTSGAVGAEAELALEGALDESSYVVGPGDVFVFAIGGSSPRQLTSVVSADGRLIVPEAGSFDVAGRTLASVRRQAGSALNRQFRNVTTDVALATPRRFSVHVSGAVPEPGRHVVRAVARVEDALATARPEPSLTPGGRRFVIDLSEVYSAAPIGDLEARPAYRNVLVRHADGTEDRVDLARYLVTGDVAFNPYLRDGDAIYLPTFDPSREGVFVGGAVIHRGAYDVRPDDTALSVLTVASGGQPETSVRAVRVTRASDGSVTEVPLAQAGGVRVGPRDQVFAIANAPEAGTASAVGALRYPGTYPIRSGTSTLASLVDMAGGLTDEALLRGAYLERRERSEPLETRDDVGGDPLDLRQAPYVSRFDSVSIPIGRLSDLDFVGRRFFQLETYRTPRLSIDLEAALEDGQTVLLRDGDRLVVPRDIGQIRVYGQISRPGYVPYQDGLDAEDYVAAAGGLAPGATLVYVVDPSTGLFTSGLGTQVRPGDAVYAAREPTADTPELEQLTLQLRQLEVQQERDRLQLELQEQRDRRQARFQLYQAALSTIGAITTVIFTIEALRN